jgi:hypothetical protein
MISDRKTQRPCRDVRGCRICEGPSQIPQVIIAGETLRRGG